MNIPTMEYERLQRLLRELRSAAGLTQTEVAERVGEPQSFVSKYESGERRLDVLELVVVCKALGISLNHLVRRLQEEQP